VSRPQVPSIGAEQRSAFARRAATAAVVATWGRGVLTLAQIRDAVTKALGERKAKAYVFDAYARGDATARDEIYILVIVEKMQDDWAKETAELTGRYTRPWATTPRKSSCTLRRGHLRGVEGSLRHPSLRGCHRGDPACLGSSACWPTSTATSSRSTPALARLHQMGCIQFSAPEI